MTYRLYTKVSETEIEAANASAMRTIVRRGEAGTNVVRELSVTVTEIVLAPDTFDGLTELPCTLEIECGAGGEIVRIETWV